MPKLRVRRLPRRCRPVLMPVALTVSMSAVVTFLVTAKHVGFSAELPGMWLAAWQLSCAIAVPARFVVAPVVRRFVGVILEPPRRQMRESFAPNGDKIVSASGAL